MKSCYYVNWNRYLNSNILPTINNCWKPCKRKPKFTQPQSYHKRIQWNEQCHFIIFEERIGDDPNETENDLDTKRTSPTGQNRNGIWRKKHSFVDSKEGYEKANNCAINQTINGMIDESNSRSIQKKLPSNVKSSGTLTISAITKHYAFSIELLISRDNCVNSFQFQSMHLSID